MEAGPKLDPEREQAILRATYDLLAETGYQGLRVDAVAARAKASKATLYRHWPTKAELVADAVQCCKAADGGRARHRQPARRPGRAGSDDRAIHDRRRGPLLAGLFMAMQHDPELAAELRSMRRVQAVRHAADDLRAGRAPGRAAPGYDPASDRRDRARP